MVVSWPRCAFSGYLSAVTLSECVDIKVINLTSKVMTEFINICCLNAGCNNTVTDSAAVCALALKHEILELIGQSKGTCLGSLLLCWHKVGHIPEQFNSWISLEAVYDC
jgi:hypothetical protein